MTTDQAAKRLEAILSDSLPKERAAALAQEFKDDAKPDSIFSDRYIQWAAEVRLQRILNKV